MKENTKIVKLSANFNGDWDKVMHLAIKGCGVGRCMESTLIIKYNLNMYTNRQIWNIVL